MAIWYVAYDIASFKSLVMNYSSCFEQCQENGMKLPIFNDISAIQNQFAYFFKDLPQLNDLNRVCQLKLKICGIYYMPFWVKTSDWTSQIYVFMRNNLETRCRQKRPNTWDKTENFETFFIDAKYNFRSGDWISGGYKINPSHWKNSTSDRNLAKRNFPILNDRFGITIFSPSKSQFGWWFLLMTILGNYPLWSDFSFILWSKLWARTKYFIYEDLFHNWFIKRLMRWFPVWIQNRLYKRTFCLP